MFVGHTISILTSCKHLTSAYICQYISGHEDIFNAIVEVGAVSCQCISQHIWGRNDTECQIFILDWPSNFPVHEVFIWVTLNGGRKIHSYMVSPKKQGKSKGFDSCNQASKLIRPVWPWNGWMTLKNQWGISSIPLQVICELKLGSKYRNTQFRPKSLILQFMWPWNLIDDLKKQQDTSSLALQTFCIKS